MMERGIKNGDGSTRLLPSPVRGEGWGGGRVPAAGHFPLCSCLNQGPGSACRWDWAPGAWLPALAREGRAQPWGAPAGEGRPRPLPPVAQGTAIAHLDGWRVMRTQPEPAKPCPSSPRRKVQKEKGREEAEGQRHLGWRGGRASRDTVGEGGCLCAVFPHGAILS